MLWFLTRARAAVLVLMLAPMAAAAEPEPLGSAPASEQRELRQKYSDYEWLLIQEYGFAGAQLDASPDGKRIEAIRVVRLEVFGERDPVPNVLNIFHTTTREHVVERELLFSEGQSYTSLAIKESARNLRDLAQLSVVLILPFSGTDPNSVRVLVLTKDVWSLRLNSSFALEGDELNYLLLNPSEENFAGTHLSVGALFLLQRDSYSVGALVRHPRLLGTRIRTQLSANLIFNRDSGRGEGSFGRVLVQYPLFSRASEWGWTAGALWLDEVTRLFKGGQQRRYDADVTPQDDRIPFEYRSDTFGAVYEATRSFGRRHKLDLSFGFEALRQHAAATRPDTINPEAFREFRKGQVPPTRQRFGPVLELRAHEDRFYQGHGLETLELQEEVQLGYDVITRAYPASEEFASSRDLFGIFSGLGYTAEWNRAIVRLIASARFEMSDRNKTDAQAAANARLISPPVAGGRIHYDAVLVNRFMNYSNRRSSLGGEGRLRGYVSNQVRGDDVVAQNVEFRSRAIEVLSAHVGIAAFYDSGGAADEISKLELLHSGGLGLRVLLPQLNRVVFRADWGFPIADGRTPWPGDLFFTFGQAFGMPRLASPSLVNSLDP